MIKVKNTYYTIDVAELQSDSGYATGIIYELEDGRWLRQQSDSPLMPLEEIQPPQSLAHTADGGKE